MMYQTFKATKIRSGHTSPDNNRALGILINNNFNSIHAQDYNCELETLKVALLTKLKRVQVRVYLNCQWATCRDLKRCRIDCEFGHCPLYYKLFMQQPEKSAYSFLE
jgi:hypothetical protein